MNEQKIFDADITPEEREPSSKASIYEGAPQSIYESRLLIDNPVIEKGFELLKNHPDSFNKKDLEGPLKNITTVLLQNFDQIDDYIDYWQEVKQIARDREDKAMENKSQRLLASSVDYIKRQKINIPQRELEDDQPSKIDIILEKITHSNTPEIYESLLHAILNSAEDPKTNIDIWYKLAESAIRSEDDQILKKVIQILSYNSEFITGNSKNAKLFLESIYSTDDAILKKSSSIDSFMANTRESYLSQEENETYGNVSRKLAEEFQESRLPKIIEEKDPKLPKLLNFYSRRTKENVITFKPEDKEDFPYSVIIIEPNSVMRYSQGLFAKRKGTNQITFFGEISGVNENPELYNFEELRSDIITHNKENQPTEKKHTTPEELSTIVSCLRDETHLEEIFQLRELRAESIKNIKQNLKRQLNPRGNEIIITDEKLKSYGYTKLLFRKGSQVQGLKNTDISTEVYIGNIVLNLVLDSNKNLIDPKSRKPLDKEPINADAIGELQLHTWILSHLEELLCKEKEEFTDQNLRDNSKANIDGLFSRASHLRVVKNHNFNPSHNRINLALQENPECPIDLELINMQRRKEGLYPVTYVSATEVSYNKGDSKPVTIYADSALGKFRQVIK